MGLLDRIKDTINMKQVYFRTLTSLFTNYNNYGVKKEEVIEFLEEWIKENEGE